MALSHVKVDTIADLTGTVTIYDSAGITATVAATGLVRPSDWNSAHNQFITVSGNTVGASTASGTNIIYQGAGIVTLSANADTIVFSASQSVQTQGSVSVQGSQGAIVFSNSNGITFGGNASTITASHNGITSQSVQTQNSVQVLGSTGNISFANANNVTFGANASTITASASFNQSVQTQGSVAVLGSTGAISFANGNGVTFGGNVSTVTASVETSYAASNHSHGNPTLALTNLSGSTASASNGLTISLSAAAPGGGGGPAISAAGASASNGTIVFSNSNGVSFGMNGSTITATINPGAAAGIAAVQAGTQTATSGTVTFGDSNGISFGMSGSSQITASYTVPSTAGLLSAVNVSAGTTSNNLSALTFGNANGVTFGLNASTVTASHNGLTTARASNDAIGLNTALTAGPLAWTVNSSGLSLNAGSVAGTSTGFTGGASISGSMTHNTAGLAISLSHPAWITTARASTDAIGLNSAFTAGPLAMTINSSGLSLNAGSAAGTTSGFTGANISASITHNTAGLAMSMSVGAGGGGAAISAAGSSQNAGTIVFSNSNGVSFGMNGSTITATVVPGAAAGIAAINNSNTTYTSGTIQLTEGGGAITIASNTGQRFAFSVPATSSLVGASGISISTNGSTISILQTNTPASFFRAWPDNGSTAAAQIGNGSVYVYPFIREGEFSASRADLFASLSLSTSSNSSHGGTISVFAGIYTRNGSTLSLASSGSQSYAWTNSSNNSTASVQGLRRLSMPFNVNYTGGGDLWMGVMTRTSTVNANWFTASNIVQAAGFHTAQITGLIGETANNSMQFMPGQGVFSASSAALPASIGFSQITGAGTTASISKFIPNVYFANFTA